MHAKGRRLAKVDAKRALSLPGADRSKVKAHVLSCDPDELSAAYSLDGNAGRSAELRYTDIVVKQQGRA